MCPYFSIVISCKKIGYVKTILTRTTNTVGIVHVDFLVTINTFTDPKTNPIGAGRIASTGRFRTFINL